MIISDILTLIPVYKKIGALKNKTYINISITSDVPERFKISDQKVGLLPHEEKLKEEYLEKKRLEDKEKCTGTRMTIEDFYNWITDHNGLWTDDNDRYTNIEQIFDDLSPSVMKRLVPDGIKIKPYLYDGEEWLEPTFENAAKDPLYIKR